MAIFWAKLFTLAPARLFLSRGFAIKSCFAFSLFSFRSNKLFFVSFLFSYFFLEISINWQYFNFIYERRLYTSHVPSEYNSGALCNRIAQPIVSQFLRHFSSDFGWLRTPGLRDSRTAGLHWVGGARVGPVSPLNPEWNVSGQRVCVGFVSMWCDLPSKLREIFRFVCIIFNIFNKQELKVNYKTRQENVDFIRVFLVEEFESRVRLSLVLFSIFLFIF